VSTGSVPPLFAGLIDDAALLPPGAAPLEHVLAEHRRHRSAWYAALVGPLVVPASAGPELIPLGPAGPVPIAVIGDTGLDRLAGTVVALGDAGFPVRRVEVAVAKRGQDPVPGLAALLATALPEIDVLAEIPLTWGVTDALDRLAAARSDGRRIAAKFRTGGLAAELYPTPFELAGVIVASREREVPFKLTAGLRRAVRHTDPETGFAHHGFLNVLAGCLAAAAGAPVPKVTELLATTDAVPLIEATRAHRTDDRPLWTSLGSCDVADAIGDLTAFGLI
jgi:hypothetical protein